VTHCHRVNSSQLLCEPNRLPLPDAPVPPNGAVRRSPGDLIKVCVQIHGRATVQQDGHEVGLDPGQLAVSDTGRPYRIRLEGSWTCAVMALPREAIGLPDGGLDGGRRQARRSVPVLSLPELGCHNETTQGGEPSCRRS
jgi:AraC-binding-like domain